MLSPLHKFLPKDEDVRASAKTVLTQNFSEAAKKLDSNLSRHGADRPAWLVGNVNEVVVDRNVGRLADENRDCRHRLIRKHTQLALTNSELSGRNRYRFTQRVNWLAYIKHCWSATRHASRVSPLFGASGAASGRLSPHPLAVAA